MRYIRALPVFLAIFLLVSCKNPEATAFKVIGSQIVAVEAAKKAVADAYVAGQIKENDFQNIRALSNQYDAAVKVEQAAVLSYKAGNTNGLANAMSAVEASRGALLDLIMRLLPADKAAKLKGL